MMLNILLIGQFAPGNLELIYLNAFNQIKGINTFKFDIRRDLKSIQYNFSLNRILYNRFTYNFFSHLTFNRVKNFLEKQEDLFNVIIIFKGMEFSLENLKSLREKQRNALWININPDNPFNIESIASTNQNVINSINFFDIYCIWSKQLVEQLSKYGAKRIIYLPFGFDNTYHRPPKNPLQISRDQVIFVGAWDEEREELMNKISNFNLLVYGNGWDRISRNSLKGKRVFPYNVYFNDLSVAVYSSAVALNILRSQNKNSHNMRTFEIPAIGGLMLTNRTEEQNFFFKENEACYMYEDNLELIDKIKYAIEHEKEALEIRKKGKVLSKNHTYNKRAEEVLSVVREFF